jgi:hypothetical protein
MVYALFPQATVSVHVLWGRQRQNTVLAAGTSIIDRSAAVNIGELMLAFGGGGHRNAGTCQVAHDDADRDLTTIVDAANAAGRGAGGGRHRLTASPRPDAARAARTTAAPTRGTTVPDQRSMGPAALGCSTTKEQSWSTSRAARHPGRDGS